jgi:hypothetical protein
MAGRFSANVEADGQLDLVFSRRSSGPPASPRAQKLIDKFSTTIDKLARAAFGPQAGMPILTK